MVGIASHSHVCAAYAEFVESQKKSYVQAKFIITSVPDWTLVTSMSTSSSQSGYNHKKRDYMSSCLAMYDDSIDVSGI